MEKLKVTDNPDASITIVERNGEKWVRVQALGEDIVVAPNDLVDNKGIIIGNYDILIKRLKELNLDTFNRKQGFIIAIYAEHINAKLIEANGDKLEDSLYISKEPWNPVGSTNKYYSRYIWSFSGYLGSFSFSYRDDTTFRCRPVLTYSAFKNL